MMSLRSVRSSIGTKLGAVSSGLAAIAAIFVFAGAAHAAAPLAGTNIGNQASATYVDSANVTQNVTSNIVTTTVQQVAALTLTSNLSKTVTAGSQVSYPLTLTNTGNGTDTYNLTDNNVTAGAFNFTSVTFYADANGDGVADNTTPITSTTALAPGGVFRFVMVGNVPTTATSGQIDTIVVTAASQLTPTVLATVTDTTTITNNAVINVNKSMSATSGASPSAGYTVSLTYSNTGNTAATGVTLTDALPTGMTYAAGTGRWSVTGATVLTDATGAVQGAGPTIDYSVTGNTVTAIINTVGAGQSGTVTFQVDIATGLTAGALNNTATYAYNDGVAAIAAVPTNTFVFTVNPTASLTFVGPAAPTATAAQGSTISFNNVLTNTGNAPDSFDVVVGTTSFPVGTSFTLYKSDGVTPLVDTNGNSTPDTGLVAAGGTYTVVLKATLPAGISGGGAYTVAKTATSKLDPTKTATATDTLTTIAANTVDLTNTSALPTTPANGAGATGTTVILTNPAINPGATTRFPLFANNTSTAGDTFNISSPTTLPAGWTVVYRDAAGTVITNTGVVPAGSNVAFFADVTVPAGQTPITQPIDFRITSPSTGATDVIRDAVVVNTVRSVVLVPNNIGQVFPGGSVVYTHTITNEGNVAETAVALALADTVTPGFTSIVYIDTNGNNVIDAGDVVVNNGGILPSLAPNVPVQLLVKVTANSGVGIGTVDLTTLTATTTGLINAVPAPAVVFATDSTTVISGNIVLIKEQSLDADCDVLTANTAFSTANITTGAIPGACIRYRITATNNGNANVTGLVISDNTPASTTYFGTNGAAATTLGTILPAPPATGATGTISATVGTLTPSASAVLTFGVKIDQ
jgi:trimeric autotransporter adhesin